jgi:hypothetical protein
MYASNEIDGVSHSGRNVVGRGRSDEREGVKRVGEQRKICAKKGRSGCDGYSGRDVLPRRSAIEVRDTMLLQQILDGSDVLRRGSDDVRNLLQQRKLKQSTICKCRSSRGGPAS